MLRTIITSSLFFLFSAAHAVPVTWTLNGVVFDDGGTAFGTFVFDADTNLYSDIQIETSAVGSSPLFEESAILDSAVSTSSSTSLTVIKTLEEGDDIGRNLSLSLSSPLTNSGGTVGLTGTEFAAILSGDPFEIGNNNFRNVVSGSITAVPVPAAFWLLFSGLGLMGWFHRRAQ